MPLPPMKLGLAPNDFRIVSKTICAKEALPLPMGFASDVEGDVDGAQGDIAKERNELRMLSFAAAYGELRIGDVIG